MKHVEILCLNTNTTHSYPLGTSLLEISQDLKIELFSTVCGAIVNNQIKELSFCVVKPKRIEFFDYSHPDGIRMYIRSLLFVLYAAVREALPNVKIQIQHGISNGYYCELSGLEREIDDSDIFSIIQEMNQLIVKNIPFIKKSLPTAEAVNLFNQQGLTDKSSLFEQQGLLFSSVYFLGELGNYFYGNLLPSTGYITNFGLVKYFDGLLLQIPKKKKMHKLNEAVVLPKLFGIFQEHKDWAGILNVSTISHLNDFTLQQKSGDIIKISEALHEKKIAEIANMIYERNGDLKVVLVAGPSASGKTTFSKRLGVQLSVNGLKPHLISLDDYFVDREHTPRDEFGDFDFESLYAIDVEYFNQQLIELLDGMEVVLPRFDFQKGQRIVNGHQFKLGKGDILIIEGIHGMNPDLLTKVESKHTFKVFISALTQISVDEHTHFSSADNRMIRRMIRDAKYRGYPAYETISRWPSVRRGEEKNIFPFQENADVMFNSATLYELAVLKKYAEPVLKAIPENRIEYSEAMRLLKILSYFKNIDDSEIPPTSLLREFLGGSSFMY